MNYTLELTALMIVHPVAEKDLIFIFRISERIFTTLLTQNYPPSHSK